MPYRQLPPELVFGHSAYFQELYQLLTYSNASIPNAFALLT